MLARVPLRRDALPMMRILSYRTILFAMSVLLLASCRSTQPPSLSVEQTAQHILEAMKGKDMETLSYLVHPNEGVRFTPSTHVSLQTDRRYPASNIARFFADTSTYTWGTEDGSGLPIEKTGEEYWNRYVWDHEYTAAPEIRWDHVQDHGSMIDNAAEVYPEARIVEYHFPGFEEQYGGMDWRSLRLMLKDVDGRWYLTGVIHDEWTP
jgi:hypothetical protein